MPEMTGVELLTEIKELQPDAMRLILSGYTDLTALLDAINRAEIYRFICKPWMEYEILVTLKQALTHRDMLLENKHLSDQVRQQQQELNRRKQMLENFAVAHPTLVDVNWGPDGSITLDEGKSW
jgi:two-component system, probable response regulator PhcQ